MIALAILVGVPLFIAGTILLDGDLAGAKPAGFLMILLAIGIVSAAVRKTDREER